MAGEAIIMLNGAIIMLNGAIIMAGEAIIILTEAIIFHIKTHRIPYIIITATLANPKISSTFAKNL
jgi:hypothetical protein